MANAHFSFGYGQPRRVRVKTAWLNRSAEVYLDDVLIGQIDDRKAFEDGRRIPLADGSHLAVKLEKGFNSGIEVVHTNGAASAPLEGSASTPSHKVEQGGSAAYFVAASSTVIGLLAVMGVLGGAFASLGFGWEALGLGLLFGWLGYCMKTTHSFAASVAAAGLWVLDLVTMFVFAASNGGAPGGIIPRLIILAFLAKAVPAANEIREQKTALQPTVEQHPVSV